MSPQPRRKWHMAYVVMALSIVAILVLSLVLPFTLTGSGNP